MRILEMFGNVPLKYGGKFSGGAANVVWNISVELGKLAGYEVYMYPLHDFNGNNRLEGINIIKRKKYKVLLKNILTVLHNRSMKFYYKLLRKFGFNKRRSLRFAVSNAIQEIFLKNLISRIGPQIIHIHGLNAGTLFAINSALITKVNFILTLHGSITNVVYDLPEIPPSVQQRKFFEQHFLKIIHSSENHIATTVVSIRLLNELKNYNLPNIKKVVVIPNGVSEIFFNPSSKNVKILREKMNLPTDKRILLTVASLSEQKNQILVLKALLKIPEKIRNEILYVLVGAGRKESELKKFVKEHGLFSNVLFAGQLFEQDLVDMYWASDYFILTSKAEGLPLVFLEAMAAGLPIITMKNLHGVEDIILPESFFLIDDYDEKEVSKKIIEVLGSKVDREKIREYAKKFTWENIAKKYLEILEGIL